MTEPEQPSSQVVQPDDRRPARGYTWEPFQPGHFLSTRHGAYSDRLVGPRALEIAQAMADDGALPVYLGEPRYRPAVLAYATVLARIERLEQYLESNAAEGIPQELEADGQVKAATGLLMALERAADRHRDRLGLSPLAAARLGRDVAATQSVTLELEQRRREREEGDADE